MKPVIDLLLTLPEKALQQAKTDGNDPEVVQHFKAILLDEFQKTCGGKTDPVDIADALIAALPMDNSQLNDQSVVKGLLNKILLLHDIYSTLGEGSGTVGSVLDQLYTSIQTKYLSKEQVVELPDMKKYIQRLEQLKLPPVSKQQALMENKKLRRAVDSFLDEFKMDFEEMQTFGEEKLSKNLLEALSEDLNFYSPALFSRFDKIADFCEAASKETQENLDESANSKAQQRYLTIAGQLQQFREAVQKKCDELKEGVVEKINKALTHYLAGKLSEIESQLTTALGKDPNQQPGFIHLPRPRGTNIIDHVVNQMNQTPDPTIQFLSKHSTLKLQLQKYKVAKEMQASLSTREPVDKRLDACLALYQKGLKTLEKNADKLDIWLKKVFDTIRALSHGRTKYVSDLWRTKEDELIATVKPHRSLGKKAG